MTRLMRDCGKDDGQLGPGAKSGTSRIAAMPLPKRK
jgi:hypothetical protein